MPSPKFQAGRSIQLPRAHQLIAQHVRALLSSLGEIWKKPATNLIAITIIGIAIALPAGLHLTLVNLKTMAQQFNTDPRISLYLKPGTTIQSSQRLIKQVARYQQVESTHFISSQQGLANFAQQTDLSGVFDQLKHNPLPAILEVIPKLAYQNPTALKTLQNQLNQLPGVTLSQLDTQWISRLHALLQIGNRVTLVLTVLFYLAILLIVTNTIRVAAEAYQEEGQILRLFGASYAMVRRPLLYRGTQIGLFGGILSWIIIEFSMLYLRSPILTFANSYQSSFLMTHIPVAVGSGIVLSGTVLGWLGAWIAARNNLKIV